MRKDLNEKVTRKEVSFIKFFCDVYIFQKLKPRTAAVLAATREARDTSAGSQNCRDFCDLFLDHQAHHNGRPHGRDRGHRLVPHVRGPRGGMERN